MYPQERFSGRGIVICAGGARLLTCAWVTINVLRRVLGSSLPIQVWHIGPGELGRTEAALFRPLDVEIIDALDVTTAMPARKLGGWELKAYALVNSRFEQVLMLDADNVPVLDPSYLFDAPQFAETGVIAWPDLERITPENRIWELCGVPYRSEPAWESGQLLVDKPRCWRQLQIALHMNMHSEVFYPYTMGDKDTFHLAWLLCAAAWAMPEHPARWTPTGIYQRDLEGRLAFQHRSQAKWRLTGPNELAENFHYQDECLRFLGELRERWSGRIQALPAPSREDEEAEAALCAIRWVRLEEPGAADQLLELLPENRIGIGAAREDMLRWYVRGGVLNLDGALAALPGMRLEGDGVLYTSQPAERRLVLRAAPDAGSDAVGATALAVLEGFIGEGTISEADAATTLATLAKLGEVGDVLTRVLARFQDNERAERVIARTRMLEGLEVASETIRNRPGYEPLED